MESRGSKRFIPQEGETKAADRVVVKSITEAESQNKRKYYKVSFGDGTTTVVFDRKQLEGIEPGTLVSYSLAKNQKGFWNIQSLSPVSAEAPRSEDGPQVEFARKPETQSDKEHSMRSMNALTNAVTLTSTLIDKGIVTPTTPDDAWQVVLQFHSAGLRLHNPVPIPQIKDEGSKR